MQTHNRKPSAAEEMRVVVRRRHHMLQRHEWLRRILQLHVWPRPRHEWLRRILQLHGLPHRSIWVSMVRPQFIAALAPAA